MTIGAAAKSTNPPARTIRDDEDIASVKLGRQALQTIIQLQGE